MNCCKFFVPMATATHPKSSMRRSWQMFYSLLHPRSQKVYEITSLFEMNASAIIPEQDYYSYDGEIVSKGELEFVSLEKAVEAGLVVALCISTTTSNIITICAILSVPRQKVLDFYLLSLSITNLLVSTLVIPFSIAAKSNVLGCSSYILCSISGYLHISLSAVYMYTFMWISVDRYLAVRKSLRYETIQTRTRCKCWILFTWVMATFLCCPPLLGDSKGHFYDESFMCLLDVNSMLPYSITLACLVLMPSVLTLCYTYCYIFTDPSAERKDGSNHDHIATFIVTAAFVLLWAPWGILRVVEQICGKVLAGSTTRFWLLFLGQVNTSWTPLTLLSSCGRCQLGLRMMFKLCLKTDNSVTL
ncbi:unnamed protein product [Larinioides sclopetarius]|uniref:G-protein coupled receptors family 1 profile domain-containing protein n=1 Tax=Larinioides sclopetarius TaxID=280406 RepID=A0AAV1YX28_9ARAC